MRIAELVDILRDYPQEWEVELAVIAPIEDESPEITVDRYSIEGVLPWEEEEGDEKLLWLVGGEDDNVDAFLDALDTDVGTEIRGEDRTIGVFHALDAKD